jgi:hypothetical protein
MSEDDGGGLREAAAQTRQPTLSRSAIVDKSTISPPSSTSSVAGSERRSVGSSTLP